MTRFSRCRAKDALTMSFPLRSPLQVVEEPVEAPEKVVQAVEVVEAEPIEEEQPVEIVVGAYCGWRSVGLVLWTTKTLKPNISRRTKTKRDTRSFSLSLSLSLTQTRSYAHALMRSARCFRDCTD